MSEGRIVGVVGVWADKAEDVVDLDYVDCVGSILWEDGSGFVGLE